MSYALEIKPSCLGSIRKLCRKNHELKGALEKKIDEIASNPGRYKPLRYGLAGERRVHIMKSFVLRFDVNEARKTVVLVFFGHHDEAYER